MYTKQEDKKEEIIKKQGTESEPSTIYLQARTMISYQVIVLVLGQTDTVEDSTKRKEQMALDEGGRKKE